MLWQMSSGMLESIKIFAITLILTLPLGLVVTFGRMSRFRIIKYITQLPTAFPAFAFFCNLPQYIKEPYKRFLENQLRKNFNLNGCPVQIFCRQK